MDQEHPSEAELQEPLLPPDHPKEAYDISLSCISSNTSATDNMDVLESSAAHDMETEPSSSDTIVPLGPSHDGCGSSCCCGCGCDYRRVIIFVAILRLFFGALCIFVLVADFRATSAGSSRDDEDSVNVIVNNGPIAFPAFLVSMLILTSVGSLVGAWRSNLWLVAISLIWLVGTYCLQYSEFNMDPCCCGGYCCACSSSMRGEEQLIAAASSGR
jgi:hypothetical protein